MNFAANIMGKNLAKITTATTLVGALDGGQPTGWTKVDGDCTAGGGGTIGCIYFDVDGDNALGAADYVIGITSVETTAAKAALQKGTAAY